MNSFHSILEKALGVLGLSSTQIRWRYYRQRDAVLGRLAAFRQTQQRFKFCRRCGHLATAADTACPNCQKPLPTYLGSKIYRYFALNPVGTFVSMGFLGVLTLIFCVHLGMTEFQGLLSPTHEALTIFGAFSTDLCLRGESWRALTMGLMHIGILHLIFNLAALSQTLGAFEAEIGSWPTLVLITATQLGAVGAHFLIHDGRVLTAGASGIAFGLIGFGVAYFHRTGRPAQRRFFLQWFVYGLAFGFLVGANHAAHLGGFITGLPLGYAVAVAGRLKDQWIWRWAGRFCLIAWLICLGFLAREVMANRGHLHEQPSVSHKGCGLPEIPGKPYGS